MDSPFYRSHWRSSPRYPASFRGIPVITPQTTPLHKPKVVSIPVHPVQPENCSNKASFDSRPRSDHAIRIQRSWRGFRVRKNVRNVVEIQRELGEVERMISEREAVERIRTDERERLKVSERLMSLLLRLDSIGGFDGAVRELRRSVTRRAIVLQEKVDAIAANAIVDLPENSAEESPKSERENQPENPAEEPLKLKRENQPENSAEDAMKSECEKQPSEDDSANGSLVIEGTKLDLSGKLNSETHNPSLLEKEGERDPEEKREGEDSGPLEREIVVVQKEKSKTTEESKRDREILEKVVEDNNKLMALMADLFDRNEIQTRILSSLSHRVEQLENAFACEKLRRGKKQKKSRRP